MRRFRLGLAAIVLLTGNAFAQAPDAAWTSFTDPTEGAFTVSAPQGWRVAGGVKRFAATEAPAWITAVSPDGMTELFMGDPSVPMFAMPNPAMGMQEGSPTPGMHRPMQVMRYRPGAEFAAMYGMRSLAAVCSNVQMQGTEPFPQLLDEVRGNVLVPAQGGNRLDAGEASFTCERGGQKFSAGVATATSLFDPTGVGGNWQAVALFGFRTPQGNEAEASKVLLLMRQSFKLDPRWQAAMKQASDEETDAIRRRSAAMAQSQAQFQAPPATLAPIAPGMVRRPATTIPGIGGNCDDLQQQRICNINDGRLVTSGGCLKCIGP